MHLADASRPRKKNAKNLNGKIGSMVRGGSGGSAAAGLVCSKHSISHQTQTANNK